MIRTLLPLIALIGCTQAGSNGTEPSVDQDSTNGTAAGATQTEVEFEGAGGITLPGTLTVPQGEALWSAVVLLPGSGPTDRDGNQPGLQTDLLKQLAEALAKEGIASLRFDKRAARSVAGQWPSDPADYGSFFSWTNHVGDVVAAYRFLAARPEIDGERVGIVGHSEGATLASVAALEVNPKALVMLAGPGRPILDVLEEQLARALDRQGADEATKQQFLAQNREIAAYVVENRAIPDNVPPGLAALYNASVPVYMAEWLALDPAGVVSQYEGPLLILNGEMDAQISAVEDARALFRAANLRKEGETEIKIVPNASHNLKSVERMEEPGFEGPIVPEAVQTIVTFLLERL